MHPGPISGVQIVRQLLWNNVYMKWLLRVLFFGVCMVVSSELTLWGYGPWHQFYHLILLWLYLQTQREMDQSHQHRSKTKVLSLEVLAPFLEPLLRRKSSDEPNAEATTQIDSPSNNLESIHHPSDTWNAATVAAEEEESTVPDVCAICWEPLNIDPEVIHDDDKESSSASETAIPSSSSSSKNNLESFIPKHRRSLYATPLVVDHSHNTHGFHFRCLLQYAQTRIRPQPFLSNEPQKLPCPVCRDSLVEIRHTLGRPTTTSSSSRTNTTEQQEHEDETRSNNSAAPPEQSRSRSPNRDEHQLE